MNETSESQISEKIKAAARMPKYRGAIFQVEADERGLALVDGKEASLKIYLTVDPDKDQIVETRFFTYGGPIFTALADLLCTKLQGKTISDLENTDVKELEKELRDTPDVPAMPEAAPELSLLAALIKKLADSYPEKKGIALVAREAMEKIKYRTQTVEGRSESDNEWNNLTDDERLKRIADCLHVNVRSTLQMDGGDLEILGLLDKTHVKIRFQGACAGCSASSGATLFYIEDQLRQSVYYNLTVVPEDAFADNYSTPDLSSTSAEDNSNPSTLTPETPGHPELP